MDENPRIEDSSQEHLIISEEYQEDILFLNDDDAQESSSVIMEAETPPSPYDGLEDLQEILSDERKRAIIERFEPGSLLDLQSIGLNVKECVNDLLQQLTMSTPAKFNFKTRELLSDMVLLIKPSLSTNQKIGLKVVPYIKH